MSTTLRRAAAAALLLAVAGTASAHTGHGTNGFTAGLAHPFGADHLLAMLAVGAWSALVLPARRAWQGPATFMAALAAGAALGASGVTLPWLEHAIAASVALFGVMLVMASRPMPVAFGLGAVAVAASLHGLAHGAEAPASGFAGYAAGFLLTTAALHAGGLGLGVLLERSRERATQLAGAGLAAAGLLLLARA